MGDMVKILDEIKGSVDNMTGRFDGQLSKMDDRLSNLECDFDVLRNSSRTGPVNGKRYGADAEEHKSAFLDWIKNPRGQNARSRLEDTEAKAVTIGSDSAGGFAVPEIIADEIVQQLRQRSPIRSLARVMSVGSSDFKMLVDEGGTSSGWVGEGDTRNETDTPTLRERAPSFGTAYAYPKASEESLQDMKFGVQGWLTERVSEEIAIQEGIAAISGNGTNKWTGMLNTAPSSADDTDSPARTAAQFKYIPTGAAGGFGTLDLGSPQFFPADVLWNTVYDLNARYRANAVWLMNSATAGVIRRFKDADGRYQWTDSLVTGQPATLCGYPVVIDDVGMPDIGTNSHPVLFGDFRRGYLIADIGGMRITIDDNVTTPGQVKFYVRRRSGGCVLDNNAVRAIKCAAS